MKRKGTLKVKRLRIFHFQTGWIRQRILNRQTHVCCSQLCHDRMVTILHHGMDNTLAMDHHIDGIIGNIKQIMCFDHLKALVHHGSGINGNASAHVPVGMLQGFLYRDIRKLCTAAVTKAPATRRNNQLIYLFQRIPLQALEDCGMLRINGIQRNWMLL